MRFQDLADLKSVGEPVVGHFRTGPADRRDVSFVWSGDTAGQGWGINTDWGGMKIYEVMRRHRPDFFIHSGDTVYADGPIQAEAKLPHDGIWKNVVIEEKAKVAETLHEFRGQWKYNLLDENVRRFNAEVPMFAQWDDHETVNNWFPNEILDQDRYSVKNVALLAARANQAFHEMNPTRQHASDRERVYRSIPYGPLLDVFFLDMRTFRGDNSANRQPTRGPETDFLGAEKIRWLKRELLASRATWKVIAADMPIGIIVRDGRQHFENGANGDGPVLGREHDIADVLRFIKHNDIRNVVWFTADVHYTAAHFYDPNKAQFQDFKPFWEFVSGPLNAGSFGPGDMDNTFGPQVVYVKSPDGRLNLPPSDGQQILRPRQDRRSERGDDGDAPRHRRSAALRRRFAAGSLGVPTQHGRRRDPPVRVRGGECVGGGGRLRLFGEQRKAGGATSRHAGEKGSRLASKHVEHVANDGSDQPRRHLQIVSAVGEQCREVPCAGPGVMEPSRPRKGAVAAREHGGRRHFDTRIGKN